MAKTQNNLNLGTVAAGLERIMTDPDAGTRQIMRVMRGFAAVFVPLYLVFIYFSFTSLVQAWHSGSQESWNLYWDTVRLPYQLLLPAGPLFYRYVWQAMPRLYQRIGAIRQAAIDGDASVAPLVAHQPVASDAHALSSSEIVLTPIWRPHQAGPYLITFPTPVILSESCLKWHQDKGLHRERHIAWNEARTFVTLHWHTPSDNTLHDAYALIATEAVFTWEITSASTAEERDAHRKLAGLIVARTGLPLRDITDPLESTISEHMIELVGLLFPVPWLPSSRPKIQFPLGKPGTPDAVPGIPAISPGTVETGPQKTLASRLRTVALTALILPPLLLDGAGFALEHVQPAYYDALLTHAQSALPIYHDALDHDDTDWPVQQPSASDNRSYSYVNRTYQLTGPDASQYMNAWPPYLFDNGVVEVTSRQLHPGDGGAVGLNLHISSDGNQMVVFRIYPDGYWDLLDYRYVDGTDRDWTYLDSGNSSAIHKGVGAANRLAVLFDGDTFLCYVNGSFVARDTDTAAAPYGLTGLYVNSDPAGGAFSNFAVYALPNDIPILL